MKKIFIILLAFMLIPSIALCSTTRLLDQDTDLRPQGWAGGSLKFKQGSTVELNERGEVISGALVYRHDLRPTGQAWVSRGSIAPYHSWYIYFAGNSSIIFDERGRVLSGTLGEDVDAYLIPNVEPLIKFRQGTVISFDKLGNLISGTLDRDLFLCPAGWRTFLPSNGGILKFKAVTEVVFGPYAQVVKGTIENDLTVNGITYPAGTTLQFSESAYPQKI